MRFTLPVFALCSGLALPALAGHGLINSFAGIPWLPEAGQTPADFGWRLDCWSEDLSLMRAGDSVAGLVLLDGQARERLAEAVVLIRDGLAGAAAPALERYASLLEETSRRLARLDKASRARESLVFATRLLEAQYIVSTEYLDLPRHGRAILGAAMTAAHAAYEEQRAQLSRRARESLFFREEEVRWSWEQARAADAQGL